MLHLSIPVRDLAEAREFYESVLGCRVGRVRDSWIDVWFFGLQLTLQERPDEVVPVEDAGVRHFGVALGSADEFVGLVERLRDHGVGWLSEPVAHTAAELSGKVGGTLADPSGNVIEIKWYGDRPEPPVADATSPSELPGNL